MTKLLLDSGNPDEYREIAQLAKEHNNELWGSTTNPSLIAKKIASTGKKLTPKEAFLLQKEIVLEIISIVPGAVSGEVYSDQTTKAVEMAEQGREIASWHPRVIVKLPTTIEGFKARTILRKENITINNTLVFSQEQVYAICLHEHILRRELGVTPGQFPPFISPFLGRLDDKGEDGIGLLENAIRIQKQYFDKDLTWMLSASIRNAYHMKKTIDLKSELITVPEKVYTEWFGMSEDEKQALTEPIPGLVKIPSWNPSEEIQNIDSLDVFMNAITSKTLDVSHPLTTAGIDKFVADWQGILE